VQAGIVGGRRRRQRRESARWPHRARWHFVAGNSPFAITVGALNTSGTIDRSDDTVAEFSSRGPTPYDFAVKPDLVRARTKILSLEADVRSCRHSIRRFMPAAAGNNAYMYLSGPASRPRWSAAAFALLLQGSPVCLRRR